MIMNFKIYSRINRSFSAKVFFYLAGVLTLITSTFTLYHLNLQHSYLQNEMIKMGTMLTTISANNSRLGVFAGDSRLLSESLKSVIRVQEVIGACVFDLEGRLLQHETVPGWNIAQLCFTDDDLPSDLRRQLNDSPEVLYHENNTTFDFWSRVAAKAQSFTDEEIFFADDDREEPEREHIIGFVGLILDKSPVKKAIRETLLKNILILLLFLGIGCIATFYIVQGVTRPLKKLAATIRSHGTDFEARDDLGMLTATYSEMVESLRRSFQTASELQDGLALKVRELTSEITKRRQIESDLRESEKKFRSISENIADGVVIISGEKVVWYNRAFRSIFGLRSEELYKLDTTMLLPQKGMPADLHVGEAPSRYLIEITGSNNCPILLEIHAQKITYDRQAAVQLIVRDITESDAADKKRKELEVKALAQSKLASLGKIASSVAHEINQPLSYLKIVHETILMDIKTNRLHPEEVKNYSLESLRQIDRISFITNHLRTYGRTSTAQFFAIRMTEVLANSLTLMGEGLRLADINLEREIEQNLPPVIGNSIKLEQVLINLFQNSMDALAESSDKRILITMRRAGEMVEILFSDSGPGIPPEIVENIFEPFFTTKILEDRSGLGLGIVNSIVREHEGSIEYCEREGWGASFLISLPIDS